MGKVVELKPKLKCCHIGCTNNAEYEIWWGDRGDQFTNSCLQHIPDLIEDCDQQIIYKLGKKPVWKAELL